MRGELLADILARELFDRHVQLVAYKTPEGTQHFVVEIALLAGSHQLSSLLQTLGSHLVGLTGTLLHDIGILNSPATEDDKERHES